MLLVSTVIKKTFTSWFLSQAAIPLDPSQPWSSWFPPSGGSSPCCKPMQPLAPSFPPPAENQQWSTIWSNDHDQQWLININYMIKWSFSTILNQSIDFCDPPPFFNQSKVHHWPTSSTLDGVANFKTSSPWSLRLDVTGGDENLRNWDPRWWP